MNTDLRLDELESRVAFQDETIRVLNDTVATLDHQILSMQAELKLLKTRLSELVQAVGDSPLAPASAETPPPHY